MPTTLHCSACDWSQPVGTAEIESWLRAAGMLRRNAEPTEDELRELLPVAAPRLACPDCGLRGLNCVEDEGDDWPAAPQCARCGAPIPPERLEVFPDTTLCVACQSADEGGGPGSADEPQYCPRCGAPLVLRKTTRGITRYRLVCADYPRCRGRG